MSKNSNADALAKLASIKDVELLNTVSVKFLSKPSIKQRPEIMELEQDPSWMDPIITYLKTSKLLENKTKARILRLRATCSVIYDDKLYRRSYLMSLHKCVTPSKADYIIRKIHEGICRNHTRGSH